MLLRIVLYLVDDYEFVAAVIEVVVLYQVVTGRVPAGVTAILSGVEMSSQSVALVTRFT